MDGLDINNVEAYGLTAYNSSVDVSNMSASSNTCAAAMVFEASATFDQSEFSNPTGDSGALGASIASYMASLLTINNSTFNEQTNGYNDFHVYMYDTSIAQIENSTFNGGYYGIYSRKSEASYTNNQFLNQRQSGYSVYVSYGDSFDDSLDLTHTFSGNTFTKSTTNGYGVRCIYAGQIEMEGDTFQDYNGTYGLYLDDCSTELEDVEFNNLGGALAYAYDGNHEWEGLSVDGAGLQGLGSSLAYFYPFDGPMNISIFNSNFSNIEHGIKPI